MRLGTALCCLVALSLVAGLGAADPGVSIEERPNDETLGDVVELTVSVPENGTATVVFEASDGGEYSRTVRVTDTSGDGRVTLRINTFLGKQRSDNGAYTVVGDDTVTVQRTDGPRLRAQSYDIRLYDGTRTDGEPSDATSLDLTAPTRGSVAYSIAPANATSRLDSREAIERARSEGWLTEAEAVAAGDTVVLSLRVDGIEGAVASAPGGTDAERFTAMLDRSDTSLQLEWAFSTMAPPERRTLNRTTVAAVVTDSHNDTYHVVLDTAGAGITPATGEEVDAGDEFTPVFVVDGDSRLGEEYAPEGFDVDRPEAELVWPSRAGLDGETATIRGRTNIAPGSAVRVRLTGPDTNVTTASRTVRPGHWPSFNVTVATDTLARADSARVRKDGAAVETDAYRIALSVPSEQSIADGQLRVPSVRLPADGYLHVIGPEGTVVGRSDELRGERDHNVTIPLASTEVGPDESLVVVPSTDEEIDPDDILAYETFLVDGPPYGVTVNVTTETGSPAPDGAATPTATPSATATMTGETTTAADGPGFGILTALLAGLLALVTVGARAR